VESAETLPPDPPSSESRQVTIDGQHEIERGSRFLSLKLSALGAIAAAIHPPRLVTPLPALPDDTPSSVALRSVKASGDRAACYKPHIGARQQARQQRQEANRLRNAARRQSKIGCAGCGVAEADVHLPLCPVWMLAAPPGPLRCEHCGVGTDTLTGVSRAATGYDSLCSVCAYHARRSDAPLRMGAA
jgi:hypothetical protein